MEKFFEAGTLTDEELVAGLARRGRGGEGVPAGLRLEPAEHRRPAAARRDRQLRCRRRPTGRSRGIDKSGAEAARKADEKAPAAAFVWKTIADPFAGRITMFRVVSGASQVRFDGPQQDQGHARSASGTCSCCRARRRPTVPEIKAGRPRRGGEAEGHADQRHARRQDRSGDVPAAQVPRAGAVVRDRAEEPRRRGQDQHVDAPPRGRGSVDQATAAIRRPRSCCCPARASCTSR